MPHNGSETLSKQATSRQASSMSGQLSMLDLMTFTDTHKFIGSPALAVGLTPSASLHGPTTAPFGPAPALANRSALPARARVKQTPAIYGPSYSGSPASAALQSSLVSRLRLRLESHGSTECILTWKESVTPSGRPLSRLVPSARRTNGIDFGLWPTATAVNRERSEETLQKCAIFRKRNANQNTVPLYLNEAVRWGATMWPTPSARDWRSERASPEFHAAWAANPKGKTLPMTIALWHTPLASDGDKLDARLPAIWKRIAAGREIGTAMEARLMSSEPTEKQGALNPEFVSWLMGYPPEWVNCAPSAMPSSRKSRLSSSQHIATLHGND
jgi:hypothetical protein